jgi:ribosomal protein L40E
MRYELYSLRCEACGAPNAPTLKRCAGCGGELKAVRRCARCQEENPPNAFVCIKCYSMLREKPRVGLLHYHIPWSVTVIALTVLVGGTVFSLIKQWVAYAEAQIEANAAITKQMELQHREYEMRENVNE